MVSGVTGNTFRDAKIMVQQGYPGSMSQYAKAGAAATCAKFTQLHDKTRE
jgi:hypothetical protein